MGVDLVESGNSGLVPEEPVKRKFVKRQEADNSQKVRKIVQWSFAALNVLLCAQFYLWVRWFEQGGQGTHVSRPAGVDGWLPIAGLINVKYVLVTGLIPKIHPAAFFLFVLFVGISVLLKKAFCSWLCPVGLLSENLWKVGKGLLGRNLELPRWLDLALRSVKYLLLAFFVFFVGVTMSGPMLQEFMMQPDGILADVKMLYFFRHMSTTALAIFGVLALGSVLIRNFWCRYACPYGALMGLVSLVSPAKIRRDVEACSSCGSCSKTCPQKLPVSQLVQVRSAECTACMECVASCKVEGALQFALPAKQGSSVAERWGGRRLKPVLVGAVLIVLFCGMVGYAKLRGQWQTRVPDNVYMELISQAAQGNQPAPAAE